MIFVVKRRAVIIAAAAAAVSAAVLPLFLSARTEVISQNMTKTVIIDAGHGFPDGGAVGTHGSVESTLNLKIAKKTEKLLKDKGLHVIMTRRKEDGIHSCEGSVAQKKKDDMHKRLEIINSGNADIFISIHMNKFTDARYRGAQVIYSRNFEESEELARLLQSSLWRIDKSKAHREALCAPPGIFLLKNARIPAVVVECGFLSNADDEQLLCTDSYRTAVAQAIADGIEQYYKESEVKQ